MKETMNDDTSIVRGSQNLFADLGYADPETHLLKAGLVTRLRAIISDSKLTQTEAALRMGLSQPDVSRLLRGQFRDVSVERLMRMLTKLGCDVDIVIHDHAKPITERDTIHLYAQQPARTMATARNFTDPSQNCAKAESELRAARWKDTGDITPDDQQRIAEALISPPTPNDVLKRAMRLHRELVDMR
jgi:predicted XRE-type DNA-binding protein